MGRIAATAMLLVASLCALGILGEVSLRIYHSFRLGIPFLANPSGYHRSLITLDHHLGWRATENTRIQTLMRNADGTQYPVTLSQDERGFRLFGDLASSGRRHVLVIGDSFTHAGEVSDDMTYYSLLGARLRADVFAYGVVGYGTLQEYMVLEKYFPIISPDLIIWQFSSNDFINNSAALESQKRAKQ